MLEIDIHTHFDREGIKYVKNLRLNDILSDNLTNELQDAEAKEHKFLSLGIHPWDINDAGMSTQKIQNCLNIIEINIKKPKVYAVGECGIDKLIETDIKTQTEIFISQLNIAEKNNKPVIIHAVRAYNEVIKIRRDFKFTNEWIIHGYTGNLQIAEKLISLGCKLSINKFKKQSDKLKEVLDNIDPIYILYESDSIL